MRIMRWWVAIGILCAPWCVQAEFSFDDDGNSITLQENGKPVLTYHYQPVQAPKDVPERFTRGSYIHPLYSLDGDVLTQDFPPDHYHHRGIHWTWPCCKVGDRDMDLWTLVGAHQNFQRWIKHEPGPDGAVFEVENAWMFDDDPEPKVSETVRFTVHPADEKGRAIDFHFTFKNLTQQQVTIRGQLTQNKGYGGFLFRPDATRKPFTFTSALGDHPQDELRVKTTWADCSFVPREGGTPAGVMIVQHPGNPGFPHDGWIFRHYGFLGASWPHTEPYLLAPGASLDLRYRLYVHRGDALTAPLAEQVSQYQGNVALK